MKLRKNRIIKWLAGAALCAAFLTTATSVATVNATAPVNEDAVSEETIAVITAAIMAYYEKNNPKCEVTVKRIKKI